MKTLVTSTALFIEYELLINKMAVINVVKGNGCEFVMRLFPPEYLTTSRPLLHETIKSDVYKDPCPE